MHSLIQNAKNLDLAYMTTPASFAHREKPGVLFLPGFRSDMAGSKASFLEEKCKESGYAYTRFDYSGHGLSKGNFAKLTLSDWLKDCELMLTRVAHGPQIIVGSSMGGWLGLRLCMEHPQLVHGFVGIAAAPDFTEEIEEKMTAEHRAQIMQKGYFEEENDYSDEPYIFTQDLLVDGRRHNLLDKELSYSGPVHLLQGKEDKDVPWQKAERIKTCLVNTDAKITYIEDGNHSLSRPEDLELLWRAISSMMP